MSINLYSGLTTAQILSQGVAPIILVDASGNTIDFVSGSSFGAGVTSVNGIAPIVTISGAGNVNVVNNGSTITISATGIGTGDVVGPNSVDDNSIVLFDGITGKIIKEGPSILIGSGNVTFQQSNATAFTDVDFNTDSFRLTNASGSDYLQINNSVGALYGYSAANNQQFGRQEWQDASTDIYGYDSAASFSIQRLHADNSQFITFGYDSTNNANFQLLNQNYNQSYLNGYDPAANYYITRMLLDNTNFDINMYPASGSSFTWLQANPDQWSIFGRSTATTNTFTYLNQTESQTLINGYNDTDTSQVSRILANDGGVTLYDYVQGVGQQSVISANRTNVDINTATTTVHGDVLPDTSGTHTLGNRTFPFSGVIAQDIVTQSPDGNLWKISVSNVGVITATPY